MSELRKSVKITGLWEQTNEKGEKYLSAKVGNNYYLVYKNTFKNKDSEPDYVLYLSEAYVSNNNSNDKDDSRDFI